jgi:FAD/FMN-containing dehydrogenase
VAIREASRAQFANVKHDISVPISKVPDFIEQAGKALGHRLSGRSDLCFGHVGDGNLHYNVGNAALIARRAEVSRIVYDKVAALAARSRPSTASGSSSATRSCATGNRSSWELMRAVKRALDPRGLMNPGK